MRGTARTGSGPVIPVQPGRRCLITAAAPSTALVTIQSAFTDPEQLALAGFLMVTPCDAKAYANRR
jgi:hypothetical protein